MPALPDTALLGAIADLLCKERDARNIEVKGVVADVGRLRDHVDEFGNVIKAEIKAEFLALELRLPTVVQDHVAALKLKNGEPGLPGEPGPVGPTGIAGPIGPPGERGEMGEKGLPGERGEAGERGLQGPQGERGLQGEMGRDGRDGLQGAQGARGEKGEPGERGPPGEAGSQGARGEKGERGADGYAGIARGLWKRDETYRANDMVTFNNSEWRAVCDNPGGEPGHSDDWRIGAKGIKGMKGEKGDRGPPGLPGPSGPKPNFILNGFLLVAHYADGSKAAVDLRPAFELYHESVAA